MTEFEKGVLFVEFLNTSNVIFASYMTLIFAMLTASWLLARRMSLMVAISALLLFTLGCLGLGIGVFFSFSDFFALQAYIQSTSPPGGDLRWLGPVGLDSPVPLGFMQALTAVLVLAGWLGAIGFFLVVRYGERTRPDLPKT
ncbi:hypothetical protein NHF40_01430 [Maricaulaceae bacterium EIL42A08]|nr:hypothetical protein [Maricaulaceae bacterium EIL42A08]